MIQRKSIFFAVPIFITLLPTNCIASTADAGSYEITDWLSLALWAGLIIAFPIALIIWQSHVDKKTKQQEAIRKMQQEIAEEKERERQAALKELQELNRRERIENRTNARKEKQEESRKGHNATANVHFGEWDDNIHFMPAQVKRMQSGIKLKKKIITTDLEHESAIIGGSNGERYFVNMYRCDCPDFLRYRKPCKHMYCLADNLGYLNHLPIYSAEESKYDPVAEFRRYYNLYKDGEINADTYVKIGEALLKLK